MAKVSHMVLPISDLNKSRDWYVDRLGFTLERERDGVVGVKDQSGLTIFLQKTAGELAGQKKLEHAIRNYIDTYNQHPKPFIWSKSADEILESVARFCKRTSETGH